MISRRSSGLARSSSAAGADTVLQLVRAVTAWHARGASDQSRNAAAEPTRPTRSRVLRTASYVFGGRVRPRAIWCTQSRTLPLIEADLIEYEVIRGLRLDSERLEGLGGKVVQVAGHYDDCPGRDCRCQHVAIVGSGSFSASTRVS